MASRRDMISCQIGTNKLGFYVPKDAYKGIEAELGVKKETNNKGMIFGANKPKPEVVRITLENGKSYTRFCHPNKKVGLVYEGKLNGKQFKSSKISSVSDPN